MSWIYYLLEANIYLVVFYAFYYFALRRETYYQFNRAYLLIICVISFIIPLLQIGVLKNHIPPPPPPAAPMVRVIDSPVVKQVSDSTVKKWTAEDYYLLIYGAIAVAVAVNLSVKIFKLYKLTHTAKKDVGNNFYTVEIDDNNAFSFLKYLFINSKLSDTSTIMRHELVHIRQRHSLDILFLEFYKIINWFNPIAYLLLADIKELHEFIADKETIGQEMDVDFYSDFLLQNAYGCSQNALTNNLFNKNLLKKRIMMLYQKPSGRLARLKYLVTIPLCALLLCASTLGFSKNYGLIDVLPGKSKAAADSDAPAPKASTMRPPPPIFTRKPYSNLSNYLMATMQYPENAKKEHNSGMVIVSFNLGSDNMISNVAVSKSAGYGFDEAAINALQSYKGSINDKAGTYKIGLGFYTFYTSKQITVSKQIANEPDFVGDVLIVDEIPKEFLAPSAPKNAPAQPASAPSASKPGEQHKIPPPPPPKNPFDSLYKYIARHVRYPAKARANHIAGREIVSFSVTNGKINNVKTIRGLNAEMDAEVVRVLTTYDGPLGVKQAELVLPVSFAIQDKNGNYVGNTPTDASKTTVTPGTANMLKEIVIMSYL